MARDTKLEGRSTRRFSGWIVRASDGECVVVDIEPMGNDKTVTKVGYQTGEQAEAAVKHGSAKDQRPKISLRATQETPSEIACAMIETTSGMGHKQTLEQASEMSALPPKADVRRAHSKSPLCANSRHCWRRRARLSRLPMRSASCSLVVSLPIWRIYYRSPCNL